MEGTFFGSDTLWRHLYIVDGLTVDEFYTDSCLRCNLEELLQMELRRNGYDRVIFYDPKTFFYFYDDLSAAGVYDSRQNYGRDLIRGEGGMHMGKLGGKARGPQASDAPRQEETEQAAAPQSLLKPAGTAPLHMGIHQTELILSMMDTFMKDTHVRTAIVVNNLTVFLKQFGGNDGAHSLCYRYNMLPADNRNIMVFIQADEQLKTMVSVSDIDQETQEDVQKEFNVIHLGMPGGREIANLLRYSALRHGLRIRPSQIPEAAEKIAHSMSVCNPPYRIKPLFLRLEALAATGQELTAANCSRLLGLPETRTAQQILSSMIGQNQVKEALLRYQHHKDPGQTDEVTEPATRLQPIIRSKNRKELIHFVLTGGPGVGKSTIARLLGQLFYEMGYLKRGHVVTADRSTLVGQYVGQTAILTRKAVQAALGGVLFIDEAYALMRSKPGENSSDFGRECLDTLTGAMTEHAGEFIVVAAGYKAEMENFLNANEGLRSRFTVLDLEDYTPEEMAAILVKMLQDAGYAPDSAFRRQLPNFCTNWVNHAGEGWANAREAENLSNELIRSWENDPGREVSQDENGQTFRLVKTDYLPQQLQENLRPAEELRSDALAQINNLIGFDEIKEELRRLLSGTKQNRPGPASLPPRLHWVLSGNPGTGKSSVVSLIAQVYRESGILPRCRVIPCTRADLVGEFEGSSCQKTRRMIEKAMGNLLFIDEAYNLNEDTVQGPNFGKEAINELVDALEKYNGRFAVVCAGYPAEMDRFLHNNPGLSSRFKVFTLRDYTPEELTRIFLRKCSAMELTADRSLQEGLPGFFAAMKQRVSKTADWGNGREAERLLEAMRYQWNDHPVVEAGNVYCLTPQHIPPEFLRFWDKAPRKEKKSRTAMEEIDALIGFDSLKAYLHDLEALCRAAQRPGSEDLLDEQNLNCVIRGNPGTGKTMIAELIGRAYCEMGLLSRGHTNKYTRGDLVSSYAGNTARQVAQCVKDSLGGVMFLEEAYDCVQNEADSQGHEAVNTLMEHMSALKGEFAVIAVGYPMEMNQFLKANPGFAHRFGHDFLIEDYDAPSLADIFRSKCRSKLFDLDPRLDQALVPMFTRMINAHLQGWANGREAENLETAMRIQWSKNRLKAREGDADVSMERTYTLADLPRQYVQYLPSELLRFCPQAPAPEEKAHSAMEDIRSLVGFADMKEHLETLLNLSKASREEHMDDLLEQQNLNWVLMGNPGTGKTLVAHLIAKVYKEMGLLPTDRTVKVTRADLVGRYQGHTAKLVRQWVDEAMGGILFIDEAYALFQNEMDSFGKEAIDTLLELMSSRKGLFGVIVAGYPREMQAFLDSNSGFRSRFGTSFTLPDYDAQELTRIFADKCSQANFEMDPQLEPMVTALFSAMIKARIPGWANGREAENLEAAMRGSWARNRVIRRDGQGRKHRVYTQDHLPLRYRAFLQPAKEASASREENRMAVPASVLAQARENFSFDRDLASEFMSLVFIRTSAGSGSGSFITVDGMVLTCSHVVGQDTQVKVRYRVMQAGKPVDLWADAQVVWNDPDMDAAILQMPRGLYPALPLALGDGLPDLSQQIYLLGYPFGAMLSDDLDRLQPSLYQGTVSSVQLKDSFNRINVDMEAKQGCSGGPVCRKSDGRLIGILCGSQTFRGAGLTEEINYVLPIQHVLEHMEIR